MLAEFYQASLHVDPAMQSPITIAILKNGNEAIVAAYFLLRDLDAQNHRKEISYHAPMTENGNIITRLRLQKMHEFPDARAKLLRAFSTEPAITVHVHRLIV